MASGDGKKRRKKQSEQSPASGGGGADARPASGRVTSDSLLSVRKQIAYAKAFQAAKSRQVQPVYRTSFRKPAKKAQDDGGDGEAAQEQEEADGAGWRMPLLFVDGYNIIGRWPRLKKRQEKGDLAGARQLLLDDLLQFAPRRFEVVCVFDAYGRGELTDRVESYHGMAVVFTTDTADSYIEKETLRLSQEKERQQRVWTATGDRAVQTAAAVHGATVVSSSWLVRELKDSRAEAGAMVAEFNKQQQRSFGPATLVDSLPAEQRAVFESLSERPADAGLSRKEREAAVEARRWEEANALKLRRPAVPPRKKRTAAPPPRDPKAKPP